ncbi:Oxidoreductase [Minicystis rosea]|nr:Oxidoreductase [Minicystis rosea]
MKIILTGATGFVGTEVAAQLLVHPEVAQVTCLTRRAPAVRHPKLVTLFHDDFAHYDDAVLAPLADHGACIWALGGKASDAASPEAYERITHTFTLAFARAMAERARGRFSFCYVSGMGADPSERRGLLWEQTTRHLKGRTERDLGALQRAHAGFTVHCFRPGGILPAGASRWMHRLLGPIVIGVDTLAEAIILTATNQDVVWNGTFENHEIKALPRLGAPRR